MKKLNLLLLAFLAVMGVTFPLIPQHYYKYNFLST